MVLKANFIKDWQEQLKEIMVNHWGLDISSINDDDVPTAYFNAEKRRIERAHRVVYESDSFKCPPELQSGWDILKQKITMGEDITTYLSKKIDNVDDKDLMLNDWGIHHLHLGKDLKGDFIERTGPLLFAFVTPYQFYALNVYPHGSWTKAELIEIIHRNWPNLISNNKINAIDVSNNPTDKERKVLRNKYVNSMIKVSDGTIYMPPGGGLMTNGQSLDSRIKSDAMSMRLNHLQQQLELLIPKFIEDLKPNGYDGSSDLEAKLDITEEKYIARFDKYAYNVVLKKKESH